ncbi:hypothetical protein F4703DRAFT_1473790 [Phycomyces blakesleeanus]
MKSQLLSQNNITSSIQSINTETKPKQNLKFVFSPSNNQPSPQAPSTNKIILDYLLYLSIQSRLKQAHVELLELSLPLPDNDLQSRKQRWKDTASKAEQDKNAVESIVAGILSSHQNKKPSFKIDANFEQRLHLCQLTNLVFGRFDATSTAGCHVIAHNSARRKRHETQMASMIEDKEDETCDIKRRQQLFARPVIPTFCRRHRRQDCPGCQSPFSTTKASSSTISSSSSSSLLSLSSPPISASVEAPPPPPKTTTTQESASVSASASASEPLSNTETTPSGSTIIPPPGLMEAIPSFLKTSADMLRHTLETGEEGDPTPLTFAGQKVMGGGMPPRWYDLFLELLTQAAIESYLCDAQVGLEPIFEIFSYGDVEDEEEEEDEDDEEEEEEEDVWGVRAADHHLLFPKTRTMYLFKTQVREREKEFLIVQAGTDLRQHFEKLAQRYPLETFEKSMGEFIQMTLSTMETPALDKCEEEEEIQTPENEAPAANRLPSLYKYPGDGALLMPEIPDVEEHDIEPRGIKRSNTTTATTDSHDPKRVR